MSTHNLCFEQKYEKYQNFYPKTFSFLVVKLSIYLNRRVFVMSWKNGGKSKKPFVLLLLFSLENKT